MYKLPLGLSIKTVIPMGFKDEKYRYGLVKNLEDNLSELKDLGFSSVDVDCCCLYVPEDLSIYDEGYERILKSGLKLNAVHMPITNEWADLSCQYEEDRKEIVKLFTKLIKKLDGFSPSVYVFHPGGFGVNEDNQDEYTERLIKSVNTLTEETDKKICVENMAGKFFLDTSEKMLRFLERCKKAFTCVDVNHFYFEKPEDAILKYGDRIGTVHISDYDFIKERHLLPKEGKNDWNKIIGALEKVNYKGAFNYEVNDKYSYKIIKDNYEELFLDYNK